MALFTLPKGYSPDFQNPRVKPVGDVEIDYSNEVVKNASNILLLNKRGTTPYDEIARNSWLADTTYGTTPYQYSPVNGNMAFNRQDIDNAGIAYKSVDNISVNTDNNPFFTVLIYTVLATPATNDAIMSKGRENSPQDNVPAFILNAADSSTLRFFVGGAYNITGIPVNVGERHVFIHRYDGVNKHDVYDSAKGVWESFSAASTNHFVPARLWIGTGFNAQCPCSFELFVAGMGKAPSLAALRSMAKNPYQILKPKTQPVYWTAGAAGGITLVVDGVDQSQTIGNVTLTQSHVLAVDGITQAQTIENVTLSTSVSLLVDDLEQAQAIGEPLLTQNNILVSNDLSQVQAIESPTITQQHILSTDGINQSQTISEPTITQAHVLAVDGISQAQTIENVSLTVLGALQVQDLEQSQTIDIASLVQNHILSVDDLNQTQTIENVTVAVGGINLLIDNIEQTQTIGNVTLVQGHILAVDNLTQQQIIDNVNLGGIVIASVNGEISIFSMYNGQITVTSAITGVTRIF